ncbi:MAG: glycogen/starch synthase [Balneolaceae bacterium]
MNIVHISAECYPVAKAGGLGDVAGALPKYLNQSGHSALVVMPFYHNQWLRQAKTELLYEGRAPWGADSFAFRIYKLKKPKLEFELILVDIPGRFDRPGIYLDPLSGYAYWDEKERFFSFQIAALEWLASQKKAPDVIHCHDHHTGLVPFMMKECFRYSSFREIPSVLTIHNGEYQGRYDAGSYSLLPAFNLENIGLLDWNGSLNALAAGIKCAWKVTTVSKGYMKELLEYCHGLEMLLRHEEKKTTGILNGIDTDVWNPETDSYLVKNYSSGAFKRAKKANKTALCEEFELDPKKPLFSFIGRLVREKGADLIPELVRYCHKHEIDASFLVLGTGDPVLHETISKLRGEHVGYFDSRLEYNEKLAHLIYAGSDFLLMPSRVEPCGLNQLYAMRYGTIPVVRKTGGLADTVMDIKDKNGYGFVFKMFSKEAAAETVLRAVDLHQKKQLFDDTRERVMNLDFSWIKSTENYVSLYKSLTN